MNEYTPAPLTEESARRRARAYGVQVEVLCMTCGRVSYERDHYGHKVTRVWMKPAERAFAAAPPPPPAWMTVDECARELMVSRMTVYRLVHSGELPAHRFGRTFRVTRTAFEAWVKGTRVVTVVVPDEVGA